MMSIELDKNFGVIKYTFSFAFVSLAMELFLSKQVNNKRVLFWIALINIAFTVILAAKTGFVSLFMAYIVIQIYTGRVSKKAITTALAVLAGLMIIIQNLRSTDDKTYNELITDMFYGYVLAALPALDKVISADMRTLDFGRNIFSFFYSAANKLYGGDTDKKYQYINDVTDNNGYVSINSYQTNVYTVIFPFWVDFGFMGIIIGALVTGLLAGGLYRLIQSGFVWALPAYISVSMALVLQFFAEYIFLNMSYMIQMLALAYIAYKFKYTIKMS
jgi:oligosaccharide repeat unit polymerase